VVAQMLVWTRPQGRLTSAREHGVTSSARAADIQDAVDAAGWLNRASTYGLFRPRCLVRAVALLRVLEARGRTGAIIRVGVRVLDGDFTAHAWVEYAGHVI